MNALQLLGEVQAAGVSVECRGPHLVIRPAGRLTPDQRERLLAAKPDLLRLLDPRRARIVQVEDHGRPVFQLVRASDGEPFYVGLFTTRAWAEIGAREHDLDLAEDET